MNKALDHCHCIWPP